MSSVICSLAYLDKGIFCFYNFFFRLAHNFRIFDCPSCSLCSNLTRFYNSVFTLFKVFYFFYLVAKWNFFSMFYFAFEFLTSYFDDFFFGFFCYNWFRCFSYLWIFYGNSVLFFTNFTFLDYLAFALLKFWIYPYFHIKWNLVCISVSTVSCSRSNFNNSLYWSLCSFSFAFFWLSHFPIYNSMSYCSFFFTKFAFLYFFYFSRL